MVLEMLNVLEDIHENKLGGSHIYKYCDALQEGVRSKKHKPLLTRSKCSEFYNSNGKITKHFDEIIET